MSKSKLKLVEHDSESDDPTKLAQMVKDLAPLVDRANNSPPPSEQNSSDSEPLMPIADLLQLTDEEREMAKAFGF